MCSGFSLLTYGIFLRTGAVDGSSDGTEVVKRKITSLLQAASIPVV